MTVATKHRSNGNGNGQRGGGRGSNGPGGPGRPFLDGSGQNDGPKRSKRPLPASARQDSQGGQGGQGEEGEEGEMVEMTFMLGAGFNTITKRPYVEFSLIEDGKHSDPIRVSAKAAKALAVNMIVAAEAAIHDAFMAAFLGDQVGADHDMIETLLDAFRHFRNGELTHEQFAELANDDHNLRS